MSVYLVLGLVGVGFLLLFLEIFVPSGVLGIIAIGVMTTGVVLAFVESVLFGVILLLVLLVAVPVLIWKLLKVLPRTKIGKMLLLEGPKGHEDVATKPEKELQKLAGKRGMTVSKLRPVGIAEIEGKRYQVVSEGMIIDAGTEVEVIDVSSNRLMVRPVRKDDETKGETVAE